MEGNVTDLNTPFKGRQMNTGLKELIRVSFCAAVLATLAVATPPAGAGTPYAQAVGAPPVCTSASFRTWCARLHNYRLSECPMAQPNTVYVSQAGSDNNPGTLALPIQTLAELNQMEAASSGQTAYLLRRGDIWNETPPSMALTAQSGNTITVNIGALTFTPIPDMIVTLTGGTAETAHIVDYNPATGVITLESAPMGGGHTGIQSGAGIALAHASEVLGDYSDGTAGHTANDSLPTLSRFQPAYSIPNWQSSTQRGDTLANTYSISETGTVAWVRVAGDNLLLLRKQTSVADVDANPGSWYADGTRLWLSPSPNFGPANNGFRTYQAVYANKSEGVVTANVDKCRIQALRVEGYGADDQHLTPAALSYAGYAIHGHVEGTNALVVYGCEAYYANRHSICNVTGGVGGIFTLTGCKAGYTTGDSIHFIAYTANGGQEFVSWENECTSGMVAQGQKPFSDRNAGEGGGSYAHTTGGNAQNSNNIALFLSWGAKNRPGQYQINGYDGPADTHAWYWTDLKDCRSFVVGEKFVAREPTAFDATNPSATGQGNLGNSGFSGNTAYINCDLTMRTVFNAASFGDHSLIGLGVDGLPFVVINSTLQVDFSFDPPNTYPFPRALTGYDGGVGSQGGIFDHCRVTFRVLGGGQVNWDYKVAKDNSAASVAGTVVQNSILSAQGLGANGQFYLGLGNNQNSPTQMVSNCYSNVTDKTGVRGYDRDPYYVEAGDLPLGPPPPDSPLLTAHSSLIMGQYKLEYDEDWNLRSTTTPAIGPYEPVRLPSF